MRQILGIIALLLFATSAEAGRNDFVGTYVRVNSSTPFVEIRIDSSFKVFLDGQGGGAMTSYGNPFFGTTADKHRAASFNMTVNGRAYFGVMGMGEKLSLATSPLNKNKLSVTLYERLGNAQNNGNSIQVYDYVRK